MAGTISYDDYLKLKGLLVMADEHNRALESILRAAASITGEADDGYGYFGHTSDQVHGGQQGNADELLRALRIAVEQPANVAA